jgi:hypothetical protein
MIEADGGDFPDIPDLSRSADICSSTKFFTAAI